MNPVKPKSAISLWWRIFSRTLHWWHLLVLAIIAMFGFALTSLAMVYLIGPALTTLFHPGDATLTGQLTNLTGSSALKAKFETLVAPIFFMDSPMATLKRFCIILVIVILAKNLFQYVQNITSTQLLQNVTNDFRKRVFSRLLELPLAFFQRNRAGDLMSRVINDVQMMQESVSVTIADMVRDPLQVGVYYVFLLAIDYRLTLILTLVVPIVVVVTSIIGRFLRRYGVRKQQHMADLSSVLQEGVVGIRIVKAFNGEQYEKRKFNRIADKYLRSLMKMYRVNRLSGPFNETVGVALAVLILWFGGRKVLLNTGPTPAEFMQFIITLFMIMQPVKQFVEKVNRVQEGLAAAERVFWLLDQKPTILSRLNAIPVEQFQNEVAFEDVSFKYEGSENYAIKNLSLTIPNGQIVALVGHSGAGKSTTADLLARFFDPTEGSIKIDGINLRDVELKSLRSLMGIVTQDVLLFNDSINANIAYTDTEPNREKIASSAQAANAVDFIEKLSHKYETMIGDRGLRLSGGERQRIAIARAIYHNPQILILDEATSALDSEAERLVQQAIDRLVVGRTVLVIAHRLSTVMRAHKIVVLDNGLKIAEGKHDELLQTCPIYEKLYKMQFELTVEEPSGIA